MEQAALEGASTVSVSLWKVVSEAVLRSSPLEQAVLLLLLFFSVLSWAIIVMKWLSIRRVNRNNSLFLETFDQAQHTGEAAEKLGGAGISPMRSVYDAGLAAVSAQPAPVAAKGEISLRAIQNPTERAQLEMTLTCEKTFAHLNGNLDYLASISSASPFIGLFGTVWGIMATFQTLGGAKSASLQVVAPGISAALIATAAGLAVAIPALMAYNWITARLGDEQTRTESFIERMTTLLRAALAGDTAAGKTEGV